MITASKRQGWVVIWAALLVLGLSYGAAAEISGVYELKEKGESRKLTITEMKGTDSLQFSLYVQTANFSGNMFGTAYIKGKAAFYMASDCHLTITFEEGKAIISDAKVGCKDYMHPGILLDGTYIKK